MVQSGDKIPTKLCTSICNVKLLPSGIKMDGDGGHYLLYIVYFEVKQP